MKIPDTKTVQWLDEGPGRMSLARQRRDEAIGIVRDVYRGPLHLRKKRESYLPRFEREKEPAYNARVAKASLFNATKRTEGAMTGMVMRKDIAPSDRVPERMRGHLLDIDLGGRNLSAFARDLSSEAWQDGYVVIFVDMPSIPEGATGPAVRDARPYWYEVRGADVLGADVRREGGREVVHSIRWREAATTTADDDPYKEVEVPRVREMLLVTDEKDRRRVEWRVWEIREVGDKDKKRKWEIEDRGLMGRQMDEIPVAAAYTNRQAAFDAEPPLLDLAIENIRHFQKSSDKDNIEHLTAVPVFTITGEDKESVANMELGVGVGVVLPNDKAKAAYVEPSGEGAEINRKALEESERHMAIMGASLLFSESRAPETAMAKRIDKSESDASLATFATSLENAIDTALNLHAKWLNIEVEQADELLVAVNRDFENLPIDAQTIAALANLVPQKLSLETFLGILKRGEILPESHDVKLELEMIEGAEGDMLQALRAIMRRDEGGDEDDDGGEEGAAA